MTQQVPEQAPQQPSITINNQMPDDRKTNHLLHLAITVLTGGLWLPIWIIVRVARGK